MVLFPPDPLNIGRVLKNSPPWIERNVLTPGISSLRSKGLKLS